MVVLLKGLVSAGALVLGARLSPELLWAEGLPQDTHADRATLHPHVFVGIGTDGTVYIVTHRSEMGTGIRTSLPLVVADELDADWQRVKLEQAIGDPRYGSQNTDGSRSIRDFYDVMREAALQGIVPATHILGTRFRYDPQSGEIEAIVCVPAGYGKVAAVEELQLGLGIPSDRVVYVGDGSSDIHVMLHVNHRGGFTIAVSEAKYIAQIAKRVIMSDDALSVLVPLLEEIVGYGPHQIRALFEAQGLLIQEWDKVQTDWLMIRESAAGDSAG